jgi:hypothetical protein
MKKLKLMAFMIGLLLANVAGFAQVPTFDWTSRIVSDTTISPNIFSSVSDVATDRFGSFYVTGFVEECNPAPTGICYIKEFYFAKYDAEGNRIWHKTAKLSTIGVAPKISVNDSGYIYVTVQVLEEFSTTNVNTGLLGDGDYIMLLKIKNNGDILWGKPIANGDWISDVFIDDLELDHLGNLYISGRFQDTMEFNNNIPMLAAISDTSLSGTFRDVFLIKCNSAGNVVWAKNIGAKNSDNLNFSAKLLVDNNNEITIAGDFADIIKIEGSTPLIATGSSAIFLIKYNTQGNIIYSESFSGVNGVHFSNVTANNDHLYLSGFAPSGINLGGQVISGDFIAKFDKATMNHIWSVNKRAWLLCVDSIGNVYTSAQVNASNFYDISKYHHLTGERVWTTELLFTPMGTISCLGNDGLLVSYSSSSQFSLYSGGYISKLSPNSPTSTKPQNSALTPWHLYPNPAKGGVFVTEISTNSEVSVTDVLGKELYSNKLNAGKHEIRLPEATSGVYFVRVSNAQGVSVKKLVIE